MLKKVVRSLVRYDIVSKSNIWDTGWKSIFTRFLYDTYTCDEGKAFYKYRKARNLRHLSRKI